MVDKLWDVGKQDIGIAFCDSILNSDDLHQRG